MAENDRKKEYEDLYELRDLIKETVRRAVDKIPEGKMPPDFPGPPGSRTVVDRFSSDEEDGSPDRTFRFFHKFRRRILRAAERAVVGFRSHAIPFAAVNAFLIFLWIMVDFGGHPWFLYPMGAWGIGLMCHLTAARQTLKKKQEVQSLPDLTERETKVVKKMQTSRAGFAEHLTAVASVSGFLMMINIITSPGFPWSLIPTFAMATGLFTHWAAYSARNRRRKAQVYGWMAGGNISSGAQHSRLDSDHPSIDQREHVPEEVREVERLKTQILKTLEKLRDSGSSVGEDLIPALETYSGQIRELCRKEADVGEVIDLIPTEDLEKERHALQAKFDRETSESLRKEYQKSIHEIDRQTSSLDKLTRQREILALRIRSAVNSLRQIQIDLARMGSVSVADESAMGQVKPKFDELSRYLDDLSDSYAELE